MKNTQLHKRLKKKTGKAGKKITKLEKLRKKTERIYMSLPKWAKNAINKESGDREISIQTMIHTIETGLNIDPNTGKKYGIRELFINQATQIQESEQNFLTKRYIFREFRVEKHALYNKLNSYMFRHGYSLSNWFYENVKILQKDQYTYVFTLDLPSINNNGKQHNKRKKVVYDRLRLVYSFKKYNNGEFIEANLIDNRITK